MQRIKIKNTPESTPSKEAKDAKATISDQMQSRFLIAPEPRSTLAKKRSVLHPAPTVPVFTGRSLSVYIIDLPVYCIIFRHCPSISLGLSLHGSEQEDSEGPSDSRGDPAVTKSDPDLNCGTPGGCGETLE